MHDIGKKTPFPHELNYLTLIQNNSTTISIE